MTLLQLANAINMRLQHEKHPENIDVVISTRLPYATCGQSPCTGVTCVGMGFDWDAGQFRITPEDELMAVKHDVPQKVWEWRDSYLCPKCEHRLAGKQKKPDVRFCNHCGQAVKWE